MNPVSARLLAQQLICPQFSSPHDVVAWMGAMQGQEYTMMRWAVAMRTRRPSAKAFARDFDSGRIIRTHLFRTTWQLVAAEDYAWMLELCRRKALCGLRGWMHSNGIDIPAGEQARISDLFAEIISGRADVLKEDLARALAERGITMDDHRLSYHIRLAEFSGLLCSGVLHPRKRTLALVSERIPSFPALTRDEALALLARKYIRSHGPATLEDFVWWSGLNISDCRRGLDLTSGEWIQERWKGQDFYLSCDSRTRGFRSGRIHLLPAYDEYLIGYKSRHVALHPDHRHKAHDNTGTFWNVILQDGEVAGNWTAQGGRVRAVPFRPEVCFGEGLEDELARWRRFCEG